MDRHETEDREIRIHFDAARATDRESAPEFRTLVAREGRMRPRMRGPRIAWMATAASAAVVALAAWLGTQAPPHPTRMVVVQKYVPPPAPAGQDASSVQPLVQKAGPQETEAAKTATAERSVKASAPPVVERNAIVDVVANEPNDALPPVGYVGRAVDPSMPEPRPNDLTPPAELSVAPGAQNVRGARERDFKAVVSGVSNVDPLAGDKRMDAYANSIEEKEVVASGARAVPETEFDTESYALLQENEFLAAIENPFSTFSIDVDTASYANVRRFLNQGQLPPRDAVRIEELVNYFRYDYPEPTGRAPFGASIEIAECPWNREHRLARIGLKGREIDRGQREPSNLVFLIDVSGSMDEPTKLPLLQSSLALLVDELDDRDRVAIVVYAGSSGLVLPSTPGSARGEIRAALARLRAGGSTNGGQGLWLAYETARRHFVRGGTNRVILATDGDFNVGVTSQAELLSLIEADARRGIFLTALGFGMGNYKDSTLELLADKGNGNYAYIDELREARKVLVEELTGTLVTIAKDVKIQVEFNPAEVGAYRLIGYENRMLRKEDFNDDRKDAGEIGAGHTVTALYEIVPASARRDVELPSVDPLRYQQGPALTESARRGELFTLKLRYKEPEGERSRLVEFPAHDSGARRGSLDFEFAGAVAGFGMLLRGSAHSLDLTYDDVRALAADAIGRGEGREYRREFVGLVDRAAALDSRRR